MIKYLDFILYSFVNYPFCFTKNTRTAKQKITFFEHTKESTYFPHLFYETEYDSEF